MTRRDPELPLVQDDPGGTASRDTSGATARLRAALAQARTAQTDGPDARTLVTDEALALDVERRALWRDTLEAGRLLLAPEARPYVKERTYALQRPVYCKGQAGRNAQYPREDLRTTQP